MVNALAKRLDWKLKRLTDNILGFDIDEKIKKLPTPVNEFGYDPFGFKPEILRYAALPAYIIYKYYFRVQVFGIENVPERNVMFVANHAGQLPFDGFLIAASLLLEKDPPRLVRSMVERWAPTLPFVSTFFARTGQIVGTPENAIKLLNMNESLLVFPEGVKGINKTFNKRYQLQEFGTGFMKIAMETKTPIVPIAVIGSEEQQPSFANLKRIGALFGMPAFPITPTFPWIFPIGILPYPVKYRLHFGKPMYFTESIEGDEDVLIKNVTEVRTTLQSMIYSGLKQRRSIFW
ncbi:MAG: acyltransferase family protein [Deltaproteobacteria bacterium]|nr:acyltransferase family protein [Deltaproteobacteria bacterium]